MRHMLEEIGQQGGILRALVADQLAAAEALGAEARRRDIDFVVLVGRGTSDNAATYGKYLFECLNGLPTGLAAASVFSLYDAPLRLANALVVGVSQSGAGADVNLYLKRAREAGALTAAVTNTVDSPICAEADHVLLCGAGPELAVAATKTYTAELGAMVLMCWAMGGGDHLLPDLAACADSVDKVAALASEIERAVERYIHANDMIVLARGMNQATAMEVALKLQETSYMGAKGFSGADFIHGPMAMVSHGYPVLAIAPPGRGSDSMDALWAKLGAARADTTVISADKRFADAAGAQTFIQMPGGVPETLSPIAYVVAGQLFAYHLAVAKGHNPDAPRGLTKVTSTL